MLRLEGLFPKIPDIQMTHCKGQNLNRFCVAEMREWLFDHRLQLLKFTFLDSLIEKLISSEQCSGNLRRLSSGIAQQAAYYRRSKKAASFHHPKLGKMSAGIAVLCSKRGSKRVNSPRAVA